MRFLLPVLLLPLLEIAGFVLVGDAIGLLPTLLLVVAAGLLGLLLLRNQGVETLRRAQDRLRAGEPPVREAFDGLCLAGAGLLLILPGFFTDILALLLLLQPVRAFLFARLGRAMVVGGPGWRASGRPPQPRPRGANPVIEADYVEVRRPGAPANDRDLPPGPGEPPPESRWRDPAP